MENELVEIKTHLARLEEKVINVKDDTGEMRAELLILIKAVSGLKVKSGLMGLIGGAIPASVVLVFILFKLIN